MTSRTPHTATPRPGIGGAPGWSADVTRALQAALGPHARLLDTSTAAPPVADWDACSLDGRSIDDISAWQALIRAGRLGDVRGAFVVAWHDDSGRLRLARDAIGERTLFYVASGAGAAFATSLHALLEAGVLERRLDVPSLAAYLSYAYVPGGRTLVRGAYELGPGQTATISRGGVELEQHSTLPAEPTSPLDEATLKQRLRCALETAVQRRLLGARSVGASLSGGLDSSLVVALVRRSYHDELRTYSISFGDEHRNELRWSSLVAAHVGTVHRAVEIRPERILQRLDDTTCRLGTPIGDPLTVPNAILFDEVASDVNILFNGEGGDPCFGGPKNVAMLAAELFRGPLFLHDDDAWPRERSYLSAHKKCFEDLAEMLLPDARAALSERPLEPQLAAWFADARWASFVAKLMAINVACKGGHHILPKLDQLSRACGVLPRSPLFDRDVVDVAFAIPPQLKLRGSVEKYLLKQSVLDLIPPEIIERPKSGMLVPVESWFAGPLLDSARQRLLDGLRRWDLFDPVWLERLVGSGRATTPVARRGAKIWLLVTLEAWLRTVLAG